MKNQNQNQNQTQNQSKRYNVVAIWSDSDNKSVIMANVGHEAALDCCRKFYASNSDRKLSYCIEEA